MWHKILFIILKKVIFIICISSEDKKSFEMLFLHKKFIKKSHWMTKITIFYDINNIIYDFIFYSLIV